MRVEENSAISKVYFDNGKVLTIVGSAHISQNSIDDVKKTIDEVNPDSICIELDKDRWDKFHKDTSKPAEDFDLVKVIKDGKFFMLMVNLILSAFQKRMSKNTTHGNVGGEIIGAGDIAIERGIPLCFADRNVATTLKRSWSLSSFMTKMKILASLFASVFDRSEINEEEIEKLKNNDNITKMLEEMSTQMPEIKKVLIDERDMYLAQKIYSAQGNNKLAVIGKGHMQGLLKNLERLEKEEIVIDTQDLDSIPQKKSGIKDYIIPILLFCVFFAVGIVKGADMGLRMFIIWAICNSGMACFGALITLSHPLTCLVTAITAPIAALAPILGVGMFSSVTQASVKRTRASDLDNLTEDLTKPKMWFKNRILHTFLILIVTSLASGAGTFIVFPIVSSILK